MKKALTILMIQAFLLTFIVTKQLNVMQNTEEIWKDVVGYEGFYKVSSIGNVVAVHRRGTRAIPESLTPQTTRCGYSSITLVKKRARKTVNIHRLMALAFIPNPDNKPQVNHKNSIKADNRIENLEWMTNGENGKHAWDNGLRTKRFGERHWLSTLNNDLVIEIRRIYPTVKNYCEVARLLGVSKHQVRQVIKGHTWNHI